MAIVQLKDVRCSGTFSKGFRVEERSSSNGKEFVTRWTVWSTELGVNEGDTISLSGFLSAKVNDWTDKEGQARHSVELAINSPRLAGAAEPSTPADTAPDWPAQQPPSEDPWNTPSTYDDSIEPF